MHDMAAINIALDRQGIEADAKAGAAVLDTVFAFLGRFVAYPSEQAHVAHTLWVAHAHMMDRWEATPRIAFLSAEPASGKTRAMEVTELLVPNPVCAVNVSPAYLFRKVGSDGGVTILFDEIDTVFGPKAKENEEIRGLLNAGHRRGAVAGRCVVKGKEIVTEEIPAYAAVALAGLGWLPDTILSRSVVIRMRRRHQGEQVEAFRHRVHAPEGGSIRLRLEVWARGTESVTWPEMPAAIQDRDADVWEPLIAVADAAGGDWPKRARDAAVTFVTAAKDAEPSLGVRLLADLRMVFGTGPTMATKAIVAALTEMEEAPWGNLKGKPLDERGLAVRLRQYGVKSKVLRFGATTARGYDRADLRDAWVRYLPASPGNSVTSVTTVTPQPIAPAVTLVTDVTPVSADKGDEALSRRHKCWQCREGGETLPCDYGSAKPYLHRHCIKPWLAGYQDRGGEAPNV